MKPTPYSNILIHIVSIIIFALFGIACSDDEPEDTKRNRSEVEQLERGRVMLLSEPSTSVAGETLRTTVQLMNGDGRKSRTAGAIITVVLNKNRLAGGSDRISAATNEEGIAELEFSIEHAAQNYMLVAVGMHNGMQTRSATTSSFDITVADPSPNTSTVSGTDSVAGLDKSARITVRLLDAFGNAIVGVVPEFEATGEDNHQGACSHTDRNGRATCTLASTHAGLKTLILTSPVEVVGETIEVHAAEASSERSTIRGASGVINDDAGVPITIELVDTFGNPVSGVVPSFQASGAGNHYEQCTRSDRDGASFCTMTSTDAGLKTLRITHPVAVDGETIEFYTWDCDSSASPFGGGNGEADTDPYRLCAPEHLSAIGDDARYMDKHFVIARDIDMQGVSGFPMIGSSDNRFSGHFDGNHRRVSKLLIHSEELEYIGLFRYIGVDGRVKNIFLEDIDLDGSEWVGGLVGYNIGSISDSYVTGRVRGSGRVVGGLVGDNRVDGSVTGSYFIGSVEGVSWVGGLVGYNSGAIDISYAASDVVGYDRNIGGLVGLNDLDGSVNASYATGGVQGMGTFVGGLVGLNNGLIDSSYATCSVTGGLEVGGLVGHNGRSQKQGRIRNSYATGSVQGVGTLGGLVGENEHGDISHSYWDIETSGRATSSGGEGITTEEFADVAFFSETAGWSFLETWVMRTTPDDAVRPILRWQMGEAQQ